MNFLRINCCVRYHRIAVHYRHNSERVLINGNLCTFNKHNNSESLDSDRLTPQTLIYSAPESMIKMIKTIKLFSLSTTLIGLGVQPFILNQLISSSSSLAIGFTALTSFGIVLSPLLLNWFTKRYVLQLYYNPKTDTFTALVLNLVLKRTEISYKASDVLIPEILGLFTTFTVGPKKRPLFVDPYSVLDFSTYKMMLGYNKPIDLKLDNLVNHNNNEKDK